MRPLGQQAVERRADLGAVDWCRPRRRAVRPGRHRAATSRPGSTNRSPASCSTDLAAELADLDGQARRARPRPTAADAGTERPHDRRPRRRRPRPGRRLRAIARSIRAGLSGHLRTGCRAPPRPSSLTCRRHVIVPLGHQPVNLLDIERKSPPGEIQLSPPYSESPCERSAGMDPPVGVAPHGLTGRRLVVARRRDVHRLTGCTQRARRGRRRSSASAASGVGVVEVEQVGGSHRFSAHGRHRWQPATCRTHRRRWPLSYP